MVSSIVLSILFAILSLSTNVNGQVCSNAVQYSSCSSNSGCGCLSYSFSDTMGVCGLTTQSCSLFTACQSPNDACSQAGYICVRHPRCSSNPLCFPPTSFDQNACPQVIASIYNGVLDASDGMYTRPGGSGSFYYEAIRVVVDQTGTYTFTSSAANNMDPHGYIYNGTFYPLSPSTNLIREDDEGAGNRQFRLTVALQAGVPYTLVVTSHVAGGGSFSVNATGPGNVQMARIDPIYLTSTTTVSTSTLPSVFTSTYSNALTNNSANFTRSGGSGSFYYHTIEVRVPVTGAYTFRSTGTIADSFGYLYQGNFYPSSPQYNILTSNDDFSGRHFGFTVNLRSDVTYILVVTTLNALGTGSFNITATGPGTVSLTPIDIHS